MYKKIRINLNIIKWCLTCCLLLGNLLLLAKNDDKLFIIIYEISINVLAIGSFLLLSFFPRIYYIFDEYGISYQNKKGKEYLHISWKNIVDISYIYILGFIPDGLEIKWQIQDKLNKYTLTISRKQSKEVFKLFAQYIDFLNK